MRFPDFTFPVTLFVKHKGLHIFKTHKESYTFARNPVLAVIHIRFYDYLFRFMNTIKNLIYNDNTRSAVSYFCEGMLNSDINRKKMFFNTLTIIYI